MRWHCDGGDDGLVVVTTRLGLLFDDANSLGTVWPDDLIILKYLAIYNNENLPNSKTFLLGTVGSIFFKILNKPSKSVKLFYNRDW